MGKIYHRHNPSKFKSGNSTGLDFEKPQLDVYVKSWPFRLVVKGNIIIVKDVTAINANGPQRQNGENQVDEPQNYNSKILVKFTCHFCDRDWSTIESSMFKKKKKQNVCKYTG